MGPLSEQTGAVGEAAGFTAVVDYLRQQEGWRLDQEVGRGGFGVVFREEVGGLVRAVKISLGTVDARQAAGELKALEVLRQLPAHPHVLGLIGPPPRQGRYVVLGHVVTVWEWAEGGTLRQRLQGRSGGLSLEELLPWLEEAAEGIEYLNSHGVYHRDIKPENLFVVAGHVKVGDLGLLKVGGVSTGSHTGVGTLGYLPPEAYGGQLHRTIDVYGLAAVYVELRTGRKAFGENVSEVVGRQQRGEVEVRGLGASEAEWVRRALSPEPGRRPESAKGFVQELEQRLLVAQAPVPRPPVVALPPRLEVKVSPRVRDYVPGELPGLPAALARLQEEWCGVQEALAQVASGRLGELEAVRAEVVKAEATAAQLRQELEGLPLPEGVTAELRERLYQQFVERGGQVPLRELAGYCPSGVGRWGYWQWLWRVQEAGRAAWAAEALRRQAEGLRAQAEAELRGREEQVRAAVVQQQREDLLGIWRGVQRRLEGVSEVLPLEVWLRYGPELQRRYVVWGEEELLRIAEEMWERALRDEVRRFTGHEGGS